MTNAEAEMETVRLFRLWLPEWKAKNPDTEKPSGNDAFGFYLAELESKSSPIIAPGREWQEVHAWLRGRGFLDG